MENASYRLKYILVGASGSGKTTMAPFLEKAFGWRRCITCTTRPKRSDETDGKDYYFRSSLDPDKMFEMAKFGNHFYGTTYDELSRSDFVLLEPQGVRYFREHYPGKLTVIQLQRTNIQVDPDRMARDKAAGFDSVHPDYIVTGDSIDAMAANLLAVIATVEQGRGRKSLDRQISEAERRETLRSDRCSGLNGAQHSENETKHIIPVR